MRGLHPGLFLSGLLAPGLAALLAQSPPPPQRGPRLSPAERSACVDRGGQIVVAGLLGSQICVRPLPDAGKSCTSSSQCAGDCLAHQVVVNGRPPRHALRTVGRCQATDSPFGCRTTVEDGRVQGGVCVD